MDEEQFFHVTMAKLKAVVEPDGVAAKLTEEPLMYIQISRGWVCHDSSTSGSDWMSRAHSSPEDLLGLGEYATLC